MNKPIYNFQGRPIVSQHAGLTVTRVGANLGERWPRLSEQIFRVDKWSLCRG